MIALHYLLGLWQWVLTSFSFMHQYDSGSRGPVPWMHPSALLVLLGKWVSMWGDLASSACLWRRSWSSCKRSCIFRLYSLLCPNMYLNCYILPPLSALSLPKLTGGKIQPAQTRRKADSCQVILWSFFQLLVGLRCWMPSFFFLLCHLIIENMFLKIRKLKLTTSFFDFSVCWGFWVGCGGFFGVFVFCFFLIPSPSF